MEDDDDDGYGDDSPSVGLAGTDCDDGESASNPGADEICGTGDNDCDGYVDEYSNPSNTGTCNGCVLAEDSGEFYWYCLDNTLDWAEAGAACAALGADLLSIADATEQGVVETDSANADYWIGCSDPTVDDTFVWTDGTAFGYDNFGGGEPDSGNLCCALKNNNSWIDDDCTTTQAGYACES